MRTLTDDELERIKEMTGECVHGTRTGHHTRTTSDANMAQRSPAEDNFLRHLQRLKYTGKKQLFPSWHEVLLLLKALGWTEPEP